MRLETERLVVRSYTAEDAPALAQILGDPITMSFWPRPLTAEETEDWLKKQMRSGQNGGFARWAVVRKDDGVLIGDCGVVKAVVAGRPVDDLGYIFQHTCWRQGLGTEAAMALTAYAFEHLSVEVLYANMPTEHLASWRVAEKIGMVRVETFLNPRNRAIPTYLYALWRRQWESGGGSSSASARGSLLG
ncbi:MAG: GNAT family N-acetyltransferase [Herpetosiphon sp.]